MGKHTQGNWTVGCPEGRTHYVMCGGHTEIAMLRCIPGHDESSYVIGKHSERAANAALIAAAPDLLAALEAMTQAYQQHFDAMPVAWQTFDNMAQEAIARARGQ